MDSFHLEFNEIPKEKLSASFFYQLLTYRAFPAWQMIKSPTIQDLCDGIKGHLDVEPIQIESENTPEVTTHKTLFFEYLRQKKGSQFVERIETLRFESLKKVWQGLKKQENDLIIQKDKTLKTC